VRLQAARRDAAGIQRLAHCRRPDKWDRATGYVGAVNPPADGRVELIPAFLAGVVMGGALDRASRWRYQKRLQWRARRVLSAR
jgi:hypothetical protein